MIAAVTFRTRPSDAARYLAEVVHSYLRGSEVALGRLAGLKTFGLGLDALNWSAAEQAAATVRVMDAIAAQRPDLKYTIAHLTVSPEPHRALAVGPEATRLECGYVCDKVLLELGLDDRIGLRGFHSDGHSEWTGHAGASVVEHLHHLALIPHAITLRGIALHASKRRAQKARVQAEKELGITPTPTRSLRPDVEMMAARIRVDLMRDAPGSWGDFEAWLAANQFELRPTKAKPRRGARLVSTRAPHLSFGLSQIGQEWKLENLERKWGAIPNSPYSRDNVRPPKQQSQQIRGRRWARTRQRDGVEL